MEIFVRRTSIPAPAEEVFQWHAYPGAFERLTPPWQRVEVTQRTGGIKEGARVTLVTRVGSFRLPWVIEHRGYIEGRQFCDVQIKGPFAYWEHVHRMEPEDPSSCFLEDRITYALPLGWLGKLGAGAFVRKQLDRLFNYRHRITYQDLVAHLKYKDKPVMKILVSGSTGFLGSALIPFLTTGGHQVTRLVRTVPRPGATAVYWDPAAGKIDAAALEGHDAVVHLAGENISQRWTAKQKSKILESRIRSTRLLVEALARLTNPPNVLVSASAIGYYGNRGDEILQEDSAAGIGFLPEVCREWEAATQPAAEAGIRVVNLRFGLILSPGGGALAKMFLPFKMGVGGVLGSGRQYWSWISIDDIIGAIHHALRNESLQGPVNAVSPNPVTNREFTKILGHVLKRPTLFPVPAFPLRLVFGEMADEMLLASARVQPAKLLNSGYDFRYPELEGALRHLLG